MLDSISQPLTVCPFILRQEMVHRGQQYITRFAPEKFGQGLVNVYNELL